ncbi:MAG: HD domain-containing protein [Armatimonadetes bacterium]|nr:HD domain-containing protein [Armatimonadota bacterium]
MPGRETLNAAVFDKLTKTSDLSEVFVSERNRLIQKANSTDGLLLMHEFTRLTDALVVRVLEIALDETYPKNSAGKRRAMRGIAIAAVGGYGRREMSPYSDVDVAFIVEREEDESIDPVIKRAFRTLMDVLDASGVKVGYSYRRVDDVENLPLETQTALFDARCVTGSRIVFNTFNMNLKAAISPCAFVHGHAEARGVETKKVSTPFVVEPDLKDGAGGLRDIHAARWVSQIAFGFAPDAVWDGLRSRGILRDFEVSEISAATEFLARTRNVLHSIVGRPMDLLTRPRQAEVAEAMGFNKPKGLMAEYYTHTHGVFRISRKVISTCLQQELEVEPGVIAKGRLLKILDRDLLERDRAAIIRVFSHAQRYKLQIDRDSAYMISESAERLLPDHALGRLFVDILSHAGAARILRNMADLGLIQIMIPRFDELLRLIPGDVAHVFTVGEHSLRAVEELEAILSEENTVLSDVFSRIQHLEVLFLATLLHDIGKLDSKPDHAKTGALMAAKIASHIGLPKEACDKVEFLVRNHLRMGETARLRDLNQRKTIRDFTAIVNNLQMLDMLLLLTIADCRAVGTAQWSQIQTRFLLELHERAAAALRRPDILEADLDSHRNRIRRELSLANLPPEEVEEHCSSMPASYLLNTSPETLATHIGFVRVARKGVPAIDIRDDRSGQFTQITVVTADKPGLLSEIAGALYAVNVDIHAAQIFTRESTNDRIAIDSIYVNFEGRQLTEMKKMEVEGELAKLLSGQLTVSELLKRRNRLDFKLPSRVVVKALHDISDHETGIEVRTEDSPGLLYQLTRKIAELGWNIHSARVSTWGQEARDVFYVTRRDGSKLSDEDVACLSALLAE